MAIREVKMYSDFKSPFAYLAFEPGLALEQRYQVKVSWKPFQLRVKDKGQSSLYRVKRRGGRSWTPARRALQPATASPRAAAAVAPSSG